jgi:CheY-like chemotaxis protein
MSPEEARILIVDDEPVLLEIFSVWLEAEGCTKISTAADGQEALATLKSEVFDLLVTDISMPRMDGIALVRSLRELDHPIPSIIFVSGFSLVDVRNMYDNGVEAFLEKPLRREDLIDAIRRSLADRVSLWQTAMEIEPKQSITIHAQDMGEGMDSIYLGRGGFSAPYGGQLSLGKVSFECVFGSRQPSLTGQGYVRWRAPNEGTIGIEFAFLEEPGRTSVIEAIAATHPRSFIPDCKARFPQESAKKELQAIPRSLDAVSSK